MILLLGLDSQFVGLEAIITAVTDMYPQYRKGMKRQYLLFAIVGVSFCVGVTMCLDVSKTIRKTFYTCSINAREVKLNRPDTGTVRFFSILL